MPLLRAQTLLRLPSSLLPSNNLPKVIHVAAVANLTKDFRSLDNSTTKLQTLDTTKLQSMQKRIDTSNDFFLLSLFRALSSHILTTGSNLRSEPNLVISTNDKRLLALRKELTNFQNEAPIPVVLTRTAKDINFNTPFFQQRQELGLEKPILLVPNQNVERIRTNIAKIGANEVVQVVGFNSNNENNDNNDNNQTALSNPSLALNSMFTTESINATRISIECGPSVTSALYASNSIDGLSLSILNGTTKQDMMNIPIIAKDPTFNSDRAWANQFTCVSNQDKNENGDQTNSAPVTIGSEIESIDGNYWGKIVGENNIYTKKANRWQLDNRRFLIKANEGVKWRGVKQNQIGLLKATKKQKGYHWIYNWYLKKE